MNWRSTNPEDAVLRSVPSKMEEDRRKDSPHTETSISEPTTLKSENLGKSLTGTKTSIWKPYVLMTVIGIFMGASVSNLIWRNREAEWLKREGDWKNYANQSQTYGGDVSAALTASRQNAADLQRQLKETLKQLQTALQDEDTTTKKWRIEVNGLRKQNDDLKKQVDDLNSQNSSLRKSTTPVAPEDSGKKQPRNPGG